MEEKGPQEIKKLIEHIPTPEQARLIFKRLTNKEYAEVRIVEDEKGLYLFDITVRGELEGEITEYSYRRGQSRADKSLVDAIQVTYYKNGLPVSGTTVAEIIDGKWVIL